MLSIAALAEDLRENMIVDSMLEIWFMAIAGVIAGLVAIFLGKLSKTFPKLFSSPIFHNDRAINAERLLCAFCSGGLLVFAEMLYISWRTAHAQ
ncbi:MAG: hypothetical protein WA634_14640 [Silvibacterium sp.]